MRFSLFLIFVALLPLMMIAHGWLFTEKQMPVLRRQALSILQEKGIKEASVELRYLDLHVRGRAPDLAALDAALSALRRVGPLRLVKEDLAIAAHLHARLEGRTLTLDGWLPEGDHLRDLRQLFTALRPDLELDLTQVRADGRVSRPEGERGPLTSDSSLLSTIVDKLRVAPQLTITREAERLVVEGIVPANGLRDSLLKALQNIAPSLPLEAQGFKESTHTLPTEFADPQSLLPFVRRFFGETPPRRLAISPGEGPVVEAESTLALEGEWLSLLRPISQGQRVQLKLTRYPSILHFPGYRPTSPIAAELLDSLRKSLASQVLVFEKASRQLSVETQAQLAGLTSQLLTAGPALKLCVGGHVDPEGVLQEEQRLAKARAEAVVSFLVEQGVPTTDIQCVAFDPVSPGTPGAPAEIQSVEILIR